NQRGLGIDRPQGGPRLNYGDARTQEGFNRGFPSRDQIVGRPAMPSQQQAYNRYPQAIGHPQQFGGAARPDQFNQSGRGQSFYGGGMSNPGRQSFTGRPNYGGSYGSSFSSPSQTYRMPQNNYRGGMEARNYGGGYGGSYGSSPRSGGFFGG